jgi:hypothetical protein
VRQRRVQLTQIRAWRTTYQRPAARAQQSLASGASSDGRLSIAMLRRPARLSLLILSHALLAGSAEAQLCATTAPRAQTAPNVFGGASFQGAVKSADGSTLGIIGHCTTLGALPAAPVLRPLGLGGVATSFFWVGAMRARRASSPIEPHKSPTRRMAGLSHGESG